MWERFFKDLTVFVLSVVGGVHIHSDVSMVTSSVEIAGLHPVRLSYSAKSADIQQCFSLTINQRTVLSATINQ
jgi:hypothetical protein